MFSLVKKMSVSIFVGKNYSSGKIIVGKKIVGKKFITGKKILISCRHFFFGYFCNTSISHSLFYGKIIINFLIQVKILLQKDILYMKNRDQEGRGRWILIYLLGGVTWRDWCCWYWEKIILIRESNYRYSLDLQNAPS